MKCQKTEKYLIEYLEGNLNQELRGEIEAHLQSCPQCARLTARSRELWNGLDLVDTLETPDQFFVKIQQKMNRTQDISASWIESILKFQKAFVPTLATGLLLAGLLIGNFLGSSLFQNVTGSTSTTTTSYAEYLGLDYWDNSSETELLSTFTQGLQVLEASSVKE